MQTPNNLPFELINHSTGEPLRNDGEILSGLESPARIINVDGRQIINFYPDCGTRQGFYFDTENELFDERLKPSGKAHSSCYKIKSMQKIIGMAKPDAVIFDLGCNDCQILNAFPNTACRIGVDISCESLFYRSPNALDSDVQHLWITNAASLPVPDEVADIVLCCDIIEHMLDPEKIIAEAFRILKPGGLLFVSVPNLAHFANRMSLLVGYGGGVELAQVLKWKSPFLSVSGVLFPDQRCHLRWFTSSSLSKFVSSFGFKVIKKLGIGPIVSPMGMSSISRNLALLTAVIARKPLIEKEQ